MSVTRSQGYTLPATAYTSPEIYEREMREVFVRSWIFVCPVSDVAEPGRFATTSIAGEPVAVVRGDDGELRALSNVCRHRAIADPVAATARCPKVLRCPYHGWTYRQDGQLAAVPEARGFPDARPRGACACRRSASTSLCGPRVRLARRRRPSRSPTGSATCAQRLESLGHREPDGRRARCIAEYAHNWKVPRRQLPRGLPHPGRPSRAAAACSTTSATSRQLGHRHAWIERAAARQAVRGPARAALPAARAADARATRPSSHGRVDVRAPLPGHSSSTSTPTRSTPGRWRRSGLRAHADRLLGLHARAASSLREPRRAAHQLALQRRRSWTRT